MRVSPAQDYIFRQAVTCRTSSCEEGSIDWNTAPHLAGGLKYFRQHSNTRREAAGRVSGLNQAAVHPACLPFDLSNSNDGSAGWGRSSTYLSHPHGPSFER